MYPDEDNQLGLYQASYSLDRIAHEFFWEATKCLEYANNNYQKTMRDYGCSFAERRAATLLKAQTEFYYEQTYLVGKYAFVHAYIADSERTEASMSRWWKYVQEVPKRS